MPHLKYQTEAAQCNPRRASWLGCVAGLLAHILPKRSSAVTCHDLKTHDYPTSTQRMGVRFTEGIRNTFRFRWLRKTS